jgi:hypothetical protein
MARPNGDRHDAVSRQIAAGLPALAFLPLPGSSVTFRRAELSIRAFRTGRRRCAGHEA